MRSFLPPKPQPLPITLLRQLSASLMMMEFFSVSDHSFRQKFHSGIVFFSAFFSLVLIIVAAHVEKPSPSPAGHAAVQSASMPTVHAADSPAQGHIGTYALRRSCLWLLILFSCFPVAVCKNNFILIGEVKSERLLTETKH